MEYPVVSVSKLIGHSNWFIWKFQIKIIASSKGYIGVLEGTEVKPEEADPTREAWQTKDNKAKELLVGRMEEEPMMHILTCNTAAEMWSKLLAVYERKSEISVHLLQKQFFEYSYQNQGVAMHISKLVEIVNRLTQNGEKIPDKMVLNRILTSLPPDYDSFLSSWDVVPAEKQTLDELTARLLIEEERRKSRVDKEMSENRALATTNKTNSHQSRPKLLCHFCKKPGHFIRNCRIRINKEANKNKVGESKDREDDKNKNKPFKNAFISLALYDDSVKNTEYWFLDSAASEHMTYNREYFSSYKTCSKNVKVGDGRLLKALGIGDINVKTIVDGKASDSVLQNVLHVPELKVNLFSVARALEKGYTIVGKSNKCQLIKNDSVVAEASSHNNVFTLNMVVEHDSVFSCVDESLISWHEKLVHQNMRQVKGVLSRFGIKYQDTGSDEKCKSCLLGKQHRLPFKPSNTKSEEPCQLVHIDLCGPMEVESFGGSRYFLLFKDDFSHFRVCYILKSKSEVPKKVRDFLALAEMDTGKRVKAIRSDNGTEIANVEVRDMLEQAGIRHQRSAPYCPEQNGRIEREMRTVVEAARTLLFSSKLDKRYWAEAVNTAVYVLNRTGTSTIPEKSPIELWSNQAPILSNLKIFGSKVYVHTPDEKRTKWDAKSTPGIFVGYEENCKAYRICFPDERQVKISRNVTFIQELRNDSDTKNELDYDNLFEFKADEEEDKTVEDNNSTTADSSDDGDDWTITSDFRGFENGRDAVEEEQTNPDGQRILRD